MKLCAYIACQLRSLPITWKYCEDSPEHRTFLSYSTSNALQWLQSKPFTRSQFLASLQWFLSIQWIRHGTEIQFHLSLRLSQTKSRMIVGDHRYHFNSFWKMSFLPFSPRYRWSRLNSMIRHANASIRRTRKMPMPNLEMDMPAENENFWVFPLINDKFIIIIGRAWTWAWAWQRNHKFKLWI